MTWRRPDGSTYWDSERGPTLKIPADALPHPPIDPPQAAEMPSEAPEPDRTPVHPARDRLGDVLDRIKAGELAATLELPAALAAARKEARRD